MGMLLTHLVPDSHSLEEALFDESRATWEDEQYPESVAVLHTSAPPSSDST